MLRVNKINKSYFDKTILKDITFQLNKKDKASLIGANGIGKSTLLKIIAGLEIPDSGNVELDNQDLVGYLSQEFTLKEEDLTVEEFVKEYVGINAIEQELRRLHDCMQNDHEIDSYCKLQEKFNLLEGYNFDYKLDRVLNGLGIGHEIGTKHIKELSGGQKNKVLLAGVLLKGAQLLLLDEPTNNLDLSSIKWLESYLHLLDVPCLIVSHDRKFLDKITNKTLEIDYFERTLKEYSGNYSKYNDTKNLELKTNISKYDEQQSEIRKIRESIKQKRQWAQKNDSKANDNDKFIRWGAEERASKSEGKIISAEKRIEQIDLLVKPKVKDQLRIKIDFDKIKGPTNIFVNELVCGYNNGFKIGPVTLSTQFGERIVIVGDNASGKTTLIKTLLKEMEPLSGNISIGSGLKLGYIAQDTKIDSNETLDSLMKGFCSEVENKSLIYITLSQFNLGYEDRNKKYIELSPGERTRIKLAAFAIKDINTLILDEPTNHLDIEALDALEEVLGNFEGTIIAVTHDRYFIDKIKPTVILEMKNGNLKKIEEI